MYISTVTNQDSHIHHSNGAVLLHLHGTSKLKKKKENGDIWFRHCFETLTAFLRFHRHHKHLTDFFQGDV